MCVCVCVCVCVCAYVCDRLDARAMKSDAGNVDNVCVYICIGVCMCVQASCTCHET
jgi:hypothetical protein